MVQNLTAEWMAQSHHNPSKEPYSQPVGNVSKKPNKDIPGVLQPSSPPSSHGIRLQPQTKSMKKEPKVTDKVTEQESSSDISCPMQSASPSCSVVSRSSTEDDGEEERQGRGQRRVRTKFTSDQIYKLEKIFLKYKYLNATERTKTAAKLHLSETQVRTWFQNRRMKLKREAQDLSARFLTSGLALHFQHHGGSGQHLPLVPPHVRLHARDDPLQHLVPHSSVYWNVFPPLLLKPFYSPL